MAKYCPKEKRNVIYLTCQECEDKICREIRESVNIQNKNTKNNTKTKSAQ